MTASVALETAPQKADYDVILNGLRAFNRSLVGPYTVEPIAALIKNEAGDTIGGAHGYTLLGWLFVEIFFVPEELRGQGMGRKVLTEIEEGARARGCHSAWLDTYNPDAKQLYEKLGYREFGALDPFYDGRGRFWMQKKL
ncbi:GNAT family N-acetyltransferase [Lacibacterium aquatile]|uniref:GNAT family N-acetyltransferase n=1 Tax=Lacibacterium aquatile TaxID=1168082 RepID=A0ABW5DRL1_9PROT